MGVEEVRWDNGGRDDQGFIFFLMEKGIKIIN
jgi:hypothetical protein